MFPTTSGDQGPVDQHLTGGELCEFLPPTGAMALNLGMLAGNSIAKAVQDIAVFFRDQDHDSSAVEY